MIGKFRSQGYAVFEGAIDGSDLAMLRDLCDTLLAEPPQDGGAGLHNIGQGESRRFLRHRHTDFPELADFALGPRIDWLVRQSLGRSALLFNEQFVVKGAGRGASFAWHQDSAYVGFEHLPYVSLWIALDDATEENGCVYLIPRDLDANPGIDTHERIDGTDELIGYFGDHPGRAMTCEAGTVVAFSSRTLHRSGENITDRPRRAYLGQYSPEPIRNPVSGRLKRFATPLTRSAPETAGPA